MILQSLPYADTHVHTNFGYCADATMVPSEAIKRAARLGLAGLAFTEHAGQLYVKPGDYWSGRLVEEPSVVQSSQGQFNRMSTYRDEMRKVCVGNIKVGLEVDADTRGNLTIQEQDRDGWDCLIGAVHWLPQRFGTDYQAAFMYCCEALASSGVRVLAHPFRWFSSHRLPPPEELYIPVAKLLARYGVAAELNFHANTPDPRFLKRCLAEGVRIAFGSDAHTLSDVGLFEQHVALLETVCKPRPIEDVLFPL